MKLNQHQSNSNSNQIKENTTTINGTHNYIKWMHD